MPSGSNLGAANVTNKRVQNKMRNAVFHFLCRARVTSAKANVTNKRVLNQIYLSYAERE